MRCSYPHVKSGHVVLLFALACCSAMTPDALPLASSPPSYIATAAVPRSTWQNPRLLTVEYRRSNRGDYPMAMPAREGDGRRPLDYQTICFYITLVLFAAAIPVHHYWRRVQSMEGRLGVLLEERDRIARECHDTLMAGFSAISWQLDATAKIFRDGNLESTPAARSCELVRTMVFQSQAEARRIIWDLRDTAEATKSLSNALARTLDANHLCQSVTTILQVEGTELSLTPDCVHHLVCIGQEAVTNAIRHAEPSCVQVQLKYESDALSLSIHDDGRGFQTPDEGRSRHGHFGIRVMEERTLKLGGTFHLTTTIGAGTEVRVRVPVQAMRQSSQEQQPLMRWVRA
jgi:signal transduction histidine kinase